jgi:pimeloyl-ACP methyl ester carboxylesterase
LAYDVHGAGEPVVLVCGTGQPAFSWHAYQVPALLTASPLCREVASAIPGCRYVEIPGVGHAGPFENPAEVNTALLQFFADV